MLNVSSIEEAVNTANPSADIFSGNVWSPSTPVFTKLYNAEEKEIPFVLITSSGKYIYSRKRKILVEVKSFLFDSMDQELGCNTLVKNIFGKTRLKRIDIYYESIKDAELLTEKDHQKFMKKFGIDTKKPLSF